MRERFRTGVADALLCLIVIALQVELWITRSSRSSGDGSPTTVELAAFSAACVIALVVMLVARLAARRARAAQAEVDRAATAAMEAEVAAAIDARAESVRAAHATVDEAVNDIIVEIVAAQQAIVRQAHPDDILLRLHAAEDDAHASLQVLRRADAALAQTPEAAPTPGKATTGRTVRQSWLNPAL